MQPLRYEYLSIVLMGVLSMAAVEILAWGRNRWWPSLATPALRRPSLFRTLFGFVALLAALAFASTPHAESRGTTSSDKALYAYVFTVSATSWLYVLPGSDRIFRRLPK